MRLSPSQVETYNECSQKWHYSYVDGLKPRGSRKVFEKGTYIHELFHVYYHTLELGHQPGSEFAQAFMNSRIQSDIEDSLGVDNIDTMSSIIPLVRRFVRDISPKIDKGIEIIEAEKEFHFDYGDIELHGIIDLIYKSPSGRVIVRDHKSSEKKNTWDADKMRMHGQFIFYSAWYYLSHGVLPVAEVNFICTYNYSKNTKVNDDEIFKRFRHESPERVIVNYLDNLGRTHERMMTEKPIRTFSRACGQCAFKELCYTEASGLDTSVVLSTFDRKQKTE